LVTENKIFIMIGYKFRPVSIVFGQNNHQNNCVKNPCS